MIPGKPNHSWVRIPFLILLILNGLILVAGIPAIFDPAFALQIHSDLYPECGLYIIFLKSGLCVFAGIAYLITAYGYYHRSTVVFAGIVGAVPFFLLYLIELVSWGGVYQPVWVGFMTFGLASLIIGIGSWISMRTNAL